MVWEGRGVFGAQLGELSGTHAWAHPKGWNSLKKLPEKQKEYVALDGIASYVLGCECLSPGKYQDCRRYQINQQAREDRARVG